MENQTANQQMVASHAGNVVADVPRLPNFKQLEIKALRKKLRYYIDQKKVLGCTCTQQTDQLKELDSLRITIDELERENNLLITSLEDNHKHIQALEKERINQDETIERLGNQISQMEIKCIQEKRAAVDIFNDALNVHFREQLGSLKRDLAVADSDMEKMKLQYSKMHEVYLQREDLVKQNMMIRLLAVLKQISEAKLACEKEQLVRQAVTKEILVYFQELLQREYERDTEQLAEKSGYKYKLCSNHKHAECKHQQHLAASKRNKFRTAGSLSAPHTHRAGLSDDVESYYTEMLQEYVTSKAEISQTKESVCDKEVVDNRRVMVGSVEVGTWDSHLVEDSHKEIKHEGRDSHKKIRQEGQDSDKEIKQEGVDCYKEIRQEGVDGDKEIKQEGVDGDKVIKQEGVDGDKVIKQEGAESKKEIKQEGDDKIKQKKRKRKKRLDNGGNN